MDRYEAQTVAIVVLLVSAAISVLLLSSSLSYILIRNYG